MSQTLVAQPLVDLHSPFEGYEDPLAFGIGWDGAVYAAARRSNEALAVTKGGASFPKSALDQPTEYLVVRWDREGMRRLVVPGQTIAVSYVQPFPGGVLLVGARCSWRPDRIEQNAVAVDWEAREIVRFTAGDGISELYVTRDGITWAAYFDEGVFGNFGWGSPGPMPIGAAGLVAFSPEGEIRFRYDAQAAGTDEICDAYALNVAGDRDVWLCFYTEFPIVRIRDGAYQVWKFGEGGGRALAVRDDRVLLFGDYEHRALARVIRLHADGKTEVEATVTIVDEHGAKFDRARSCAVGDRLYLFQDRRAFVVDGW